MSAAEAFHDHLDTCARCRFGPFDLCPEGARLLRVAVDAGPVIVCDSVTEAWESLRRKQGK